MGSYLKISIWDAILCTMAAGGLAANIYMGYDMKDHLSGNIVAVMGISLIIVALIFLTFYNRITKIAGGACLLVCLVFAIIYTHNVHPFLNEKTASGGIFWIVILLVAIITYLNTRIKFGTFVYFVLGNIVAAGAVFLEFGISIPGYIFFLVGAAGSIFMCVYRKNLEESETAAVQLTGYAIQIFLCCFVALVMTIGIFFMVIHPLNPKTHELKLIQTLQSMEMVHKIGTTAILPELDEDLNSSQEAEDTTDLDVSQEFDSEADSEASGEESYENDNKTEETHEMNPDEVSDDVKTQQKQGINPKIERDAQAIKYSKLHLGWLWITLSILAAIVLSVILKRYLRKRWLEKTLAMGNRNAIVIMYRYFVRTMDKLKVPRNPSQTPEECALAGRKYTAPYIYGDCNFEKVTDTYVKAAYSLGEISDQQVSQYIDVYHQLFHNIREEKGIWKYILLFYRI